MLRASLTALLLSATPVAAQDWSFIDPLMAQSLDIRPGEGAATLLPDNLDPNAATVARRVPLLRKPHRRERRHAQCRALPAGRQRLELCRTG